MTTPIPGDTIHFLKSGFSFLVNNGLASAAVSTRGQQVTVTSELLEANQDRDGVSFLDFDAEGQVEKYGGQIWAVGPTPDDFIMTQPGHADHDIARSDARRAAWQEPDPAVRLQKLHDIEAKYGRAPSTQVSSAIMGDRERDEMLRQAGLKE